MNDENTYTTKRGRQVRFIGIQGLLDRFHASHQEPPAPMYEVAVMGGAIERHPLTDVKDRSTLSDDERSILDEYDKRIDQFKTKSGTEFVNLILQRGIDIGSDDDAWATEQKEQFGIDVPDDPKERRTHYLTTEVFYGSPDEVKEDISRIISGVLIASGMDREKVAELTAIFQGQMGLKAVSGIGNQGRPLVIQRKISASGHRSRPNGKANKLVRRPKRR